MDSKRIEISQKTIIFTALFLLFLWLMFAIRTVLLAIFIALIIMSALNPLVKFLEKRRIPRNISIVLIFVLIFLLVGSLLAAVIPATVNQTKSLFLQFPQIIEQLGIHSINQQVLSDQLGSIPGNIAKLVINAFSNLVAVFTLFVVSYYLLLERANLHHYLISFLGNDALEKKTENLINKLEERIGGWVSGQLTLMLIIGTLTYIGLTILNISYALPLAVIAGLFEIIPNIGPTISALPAVLIATSVSPVSALITIALYFLIQQFENTIIVPKVMQKAVGVKPLTTIFSLMIGIQLAGVLGAILAVPGYLMLKIGLEEFFGFADNS